MRVHFQVIPSDRCPDSKGHGANMGPIWGRQDPGGPHVGPMNFAIWVGLGPSLKSRWDRSVISQSIKPDELHWSLVTNREQEMNIGWHVGSVRSNTGKMYGAGLKIDYLGRDDILQTLCYAMHLYLGLLPDHNISVNISKTKSKEPILIMYCDQHISLCLIHYNHIFCNSIW